MARTGTLIMARSGRGGWHEQHECAVRMVVVITPDVDLLILHRSTASPRSRLYLPLAPRHPYLRYAEQLQTGD